MLSSQRRESLTKKIERRPKFHDSPDILASGPKGVKLQRVPNVLDRNGLIAFSRLQSGLVFDAATDAFLLKWGELFLKISALSCGT